MLKRNAKPVAMMHNKSSEGGTGPFIHIVVQSRDRHSIQCHFGVLDSDWVDGRKAADIYDEWVRLIAKPTTQKNPPPSNTLQRCVRRRPS